MKKQVTRKSFDRHVKASHSSEATLFCSCFFVTVFVSVTDSQRVTRLSRVLTLDTSCVIIVREKQRDKQRANFHVKLKNDNMPKKDASSASMCIISRVTFRHSFFEKKAENTARKGVARHDDALLLDSERMMIKENHKQFDVSETLKVTTPYKENREERMCDHLGRQHHCNIEARIESWIESVFLSQNTHTQNLYVFTRMRAEPQ